MIQQTVDKMLQPLRLRYRASPLPAFFAWWGGELSRLVPEAWWRRLMPPKPQLWIVPAATGGGDLRIWRADDQLRPLDVFGAGEDARLLATRWRDLLAEFNDGRPEVRLCLNANDYLGIPVQLPAAVQDNLRAALGFQIDQLSPFRPEQVYFDQQVVNQDAARGRIDVELRLARREDIDALLARMREIGIAVHVVDTLGQEDPPANEGYNLLPEDRRPHYSHARARFNLMLALVLIVLLGLVMGETLVMRERTATQLAEEASRLREQAMAVAALEQELGDTLQAANFLAEKRSQEAPAIVVLDEITRVLPDDMWLQQFQLQGRELRIQGMAEGSQRVVGLLNASPLLESPEITGNISIDPMTGKERFRTQARITAIPVSPAGRSGEESLPSEGETP